MKNNTKTHEMTHDHVYGYDREVYKPIKEPPKQFSQGMWVTKDLRCELFRDVADECVVVTFLENNHLEL